MASSGESERSWYDRALLGLTFNGALAVQCAAALLGPFTVPSITTYFIAGSLMSWAFALFAPNEDGSFITPASLRKRSKEFFETDSPHMAICGPAGSGKSSLINALRGLRNSEDNTAKTGPVETTIHREKYQSHVNINSPFLYDFPGAGTQRVPAGNYYDNQKLELFDWVLIVQGERIGEVSV
jgi:hypothetical protein